ncbi:UNVERIFIED_CONTAM: hypothetical protein Sradi_2251200 [Sesamum radiatum]|uniref:Uncharacterized protein n=1 Tax=Sesamum radiatum TaxID=300843 RepID=A0AAW2T3P2_SESRA
MFHSTICPNSFFRKLPLSDLAGNKDLYIAGGVKTPADGMGSPGHARKLAMAILSAPV